ncbi:MAG: glycosyltransferase family 2 protein [Acidimicrobiales bacterium]
MPAYRAETFIGATIESVLAQTYSHWELIVLDNNSPDRTGQIARSFDDPRIRVEQNRETLELADNWNAVAAMATAPYLKLLCADDVLHPDCLAEQVAVLERNPEVALVASRRDFIGSAGEVVLRDRGLSGLIGMQPSDAVVERVVRSGINPIGLPAALLLRRSVFVDVGAFDSRWLYPIDLELSLRMLRKGEFFGLSRSLASFRISPASASSTMKHEGNQHREMIRTVAGDPRWTIRRRSLLRGLSLSYVETVKKRMLFAAVNSRWRPVRRIPSLFLGAWAGSPRIEDDVETAGQAAVVLQEPRG